MNIGIHYWEPPHVIQFGSNFWGVRNYAGHMCRQALKQPKCVKKGYLAKMQGDEKGMEMAS